MPANPDFDQILSTTLSEHRARLTDNVFSETPLLNELKRSGRIEMVDGGHDIVEPLIHAMNDTVKPYSGWDVLDITPQEGLSAARFPWRQLAASVAINGIEEAMNSGKNAVINLLKAKIEQAEKSYSEVLNEMCFGDGVNFQGAANPKTWYGLQLLVGTGAVGGIDPAVAGNEFWQSVVIAADEDAAGPDTTAFDERQWAKAFLTASRGSDQPNFIVTTQDLFLAYEDSLIPQRRYVSDKADSRFQTLVFKGQPLYNDPYCPAGSTFFLNLRYLGLKGLSSKWFKNTKFREVPDVDGRWSLILSYGNMTVRNRARQAVVTGQTIA